MKTVNFIKALEIISENHSTEISINYVKPNGFVDVGKSNPTLRIKSCCAGVVNRLHDAGYALSMDNGSLVVEDYSIRIKSLTDEA